MLPMADLWYDHSSFYRSLIQNIKMTNNGNGLFSDSQESALLDDETFSVIEKDIGRGTLSLLTETGHELLSIPSGGKRDFNQDESDYNLMTLTNIGKKLKKEEIEEIEEKYYPMPDLPLQLDDTFPGKLNFQYSFADGGGQDWIYSDQLDKVFIKMEKTLPLRFTWDPPTDGLYLRTAMVFKLEEYRSDPVKRCHNHMASTNIINQNMDPRKIKHVVHCVNHSSSIYEDRNEHLSVLTPLCTPEPGSPYVPMCFKFLCKNSCPSGMNRRPTELIFTLENRTNTVLGRRKLLIRVCSCPKRDKNKEEEELIPKNRKLIPSGKKISDKHVFKVDINVVGKESYLAVLKYAYDVMAGQAVKTGQIEFFKPFMEEILHKTP